MALPDIRVRNGITFEWLDDPSVPNRRWRARMSREVFAELVKQKLKTSPDVPAHVPQSVTAKRPSFLASQQPTKS